MVVHTLEEFRLKTLSLGKIVFLDTDMFSLSCERVLLGAVVTGGAIDNNSLVRCAMMMFFNNPDNMGFITTQIQSAFPGWRAPDAIVLMEINMPITEDSAASIIVICLAVGFPYTDDLCERIATYVQAKLNANMRDVDGDQ